MRRRLLASEGAAPGLVLLALELYLNWSYRAVFAPMVAARPVAGAGVVVARA